MEFLKIGITIALAVIGWVIGHYFNTRRDIELKKRDISLTHLINSYRILTNEVSHRSESAKRKESLEVIISDIQLFGSIEQVTLAKQLATEVASGKEFELDPLINSLRNDLRSELGLPVVSGNVTWLRFK